MTTIASHWAWYVARKSLVCSSLGLLGIFVGAACVLLPPMVPIGFVAILAGFLLWVMPDVRAVPERWTRACIFPFVFSVLCVPVYYAIILPDVPWISIRRLFLVALVAPLSVIIAGSSQHRRLFLSRFAEAPFLRLCFVGFLCVMALSTLPAVRPFLSVSYNLMLVLTCFLPMVAVIMFVRTEQVILNIFRLAIICVGLNLLVGAIESYLRKPFLIYALPAYMRDQIIAENPLALISYVNGGIRDGIYRASSTFSNSLTWGEMSAMLAPMCLHFLFHSKSLAGRIYGTVGYAMCLFSVFLSGSRGAYVGMIGASIVYTIVWAIRECRNRPERLAGKIWLLFYMLASVSAVLAVFFVPRIHIMVLGGGNTGSSNQARSDQWALALPKILARPWGYGGGAAADVIHFTGMAGPDSSPSVDCYLLNLLVDYGVLGFVFFSGIFFAAIFICLRIYIWGSGKQTSVGGALGASMIAFLIYRLTLSQTDSLAIAFMLVGLTIVFRHMTVQKTQIPGMRATHLDKSAGYASTQNQVLSRSGLEPMRCGDLLHLAP